MALTITVTKIGIFLFEIVGRKRKRLQLKIANLKIAAIVVTKTQPKLHVWPGLYLPYQTFSEILDFFVYVLKDIIALLDFFAI